MTFDRMKDVQKRIEEEIGRAYDYARLAISIEEEALADTYHEIAREQMKHYYMLSKTVDGIVEQEDQATQMLCEYLHERMSEKASKVNTLLAMYRAKGQK